MKELGGVEDCRMQKAEAARTRYDVKGRITVESRDTFQKKGYCDRNIQIRATLADTRSSAPTSRYKTGRIDYNARHEIGHEYQQRQTSIHIASGLEMFQV